ncbi:glycosyltransferase family 4 protein [Aquipuribacter nitratireducens]|uniref:D-inositol 3-phosphate glycosyltransferase n=1 Tax=Aquipuribacter nitratireducens TaxID=650104 RepID=A0ABW0GRX5_9MICO
MSRPLRVALVCPYDLDAVGGVREQVLGLADALTARGHVVEVVGPRSARPGTGPGDLVGHRAGQRVRPVGRAVGVPTNGSTARLGLGPGARSEAAARVAGGGFDVVHVHEPIPPGIGHSVLRRLAQDRAAAGPHARRPPAVVATVHVAMSPHPAGRSRALRTAARHVRGVLRGVDLLSAVSDHARRTVVDHLGRDALVLPNGVDVAGWAAAADTSPATHDRAPTAVVLGRAGEPRKGVDVLLAAWPAVRRAVPDARLLVVGPRDGARLPLGAGVEATGAVPEADKRRLVAEADVLVAPHRGGESFGLVLVEAMAAGTSVVASDLPAFRDVLAGSGRLVPVGDPVALAAALVGVLEDPAAARAGAPAARVRAEEFAWPAVAAGWEEAYHLALRLQPPGDAAAGARQALHDALTDRAALAVRLTARHADDGTPGVLRTLAAAAGAALDPTDLAAQNRLSVLARDPDLPPAVRQALAGATSRVARTRLVVNDLARRGRRPTVELDDAAPASSQVPPPARSAPRLAGCP